jgi:cobalt-zinc-cadmium efflux system membrane fusion protein
MKKYIKMNKVLLPVFILTMAFALSSCGDKKAKEENAVNTADSTSHPEDENTVEITKSQYQTVGIALGSAEMKALSGVLKVNGFIDVPPQNLVSITTQMGGIVKSTPLLQGTIVKKGQVIAVLQNQDYVMLQQDYLESKSQLEFTDTEYKRQQTLSQQNVNSQKTVQQSKANYQSTLAKVNALAERLRLININPNSLTAGNIRSQINIYAPITGSVTKVNVNVGKFVNTNDVLFEIVDGSNLHVELNVFEKDAAKVKPGQKVRFSLTNDSTERMATVKLVGKEINPDKTITVHSVASGSGISFIPGTYLKAYIETGNVEVLSLPESAVVDFEGKKYIFIAKDGQTKQAHQHQKAESEQQLEAAGEMFHFEMTPITTGIIDAGYVEVQIPENLQTKGNIVLKGAYDLLSKMKNSEEE